MTLSYIQRTSIKILLFPLFPLCFLFILLILPISLIIKPFSRKHSIYIGTFSCYAFWSIMKIFFRLSISMNIPQVPKNNYIVISNHISSTDFMVINALNTHNLKDAKYIIKRSLRAVPLFYQTALLAKFLIISRSFETDRELILRYLQATSGMQLPMWLVIYSEGHRFTEELAAESAEFCRSRGIQPFRNVLCPRYKGFELIIKGLGDKHIKKILDITVYPLDGTPSLLDIVIGGRKFSYKCDTRVVDIADVDDPRAFLEEAFRRKDALIDQWRKNKSM